MPTPTICIDSDFLGSSRHFVIDDGYTWSDSVPRGSWHLSGECKTAPTSRCLDTLLRLAAKPLPTLPHRYLKAMATLATGSHPPVAWQHAVPQVVYQKYFKNLIQETSSYFPDLPTDYYETVWTAGSRLLNSLKPAKVDVARWSQLSADPHGNATVVDSFKPGRTGYARPVTYNRFGTRTGRLTVEDGPNILTLKRECRDMLRSAFPDGTVCSLDFSALEVRIVLAAAGRSSSATDIYADIATNLFGGEVQRNVVKVAVISELYGVSRSALVARLQVSDDKVDKFIDVIKEHFKLRELRQQLKDELQASGRLRSRFGRPLVLAEGHDNLLINTYAQSTGVDVTMLGFDSVVRSLGTEGIRPLFVLHDALFLDVRGDRMRDVQACDAVSVTGYEDLFPLKLEIIHDTKNP
jgi:hypothetical protein